MPDDEYFIEWMHRLIAATTGTLVIATMVASWINKNADQKIKITSTLATIFVITQITLGALVIDLKTSRGTCCNPFRNRYFCYSQWYY